MAVCCVIYQSGEFKKKDKLAKPKPSHKGTVIYRLKPFRNQVRSQSKALARELVGQGSVKWLEHCVKAADAQHTAAQPSTI